MSGSTIVSWGSEAEFDLLACLLQVHTGGRGQLIGPGGVCFLLSFQQGVVNYKVNITGADVTLDTS